MWGSRGGTTDSDTSQVTVAGFVHGCMLIIMQILTGAEGTLKNNVPQLYTVSGKKRGHVIFNYNSRISWSIFIICVPLETGMNTLQLYVIYLLKCLMSS